MGPISDHPCIMTISHAIAWGIKGLGFRIQGSELGFRVQGIGLRIEGLGFRV